MAKVKAKTATARKAAAKKTRKKATKKAVRSEAAAKRAPAKKAAKAVPPVYLEHPEGMFERLASLREEMDHLFGSLSRSFGFPELRMPSIELPARAGIADVRFEVSESDKEVEVTAEAPGLDPEDLEITLSEGMLTVKGQKRDRREQKGKDYYISERRYGSFSRSFQAPESVDEDKISAKFENGVLSIRLPKHGKPKRRPKSIRVAKE
jgi:HSP20 family protein